MKNQKSKQLLVEGKDDLHSIVHLMRNYTNWPEKFEDAPVLLKDVGGVEKILDRTFIETTLKGSGLEVLGIVLDADVDPAGRWNSLKRLLQNIALELPNELPREGLIATLPSGIRFGFWLMPDCSMNGMLETFLKWLIPDVQNQLFLHAVESFSKARDLGATCNQAHAEKAEIHTWLAWQDPPGEPFGSAINQRILDPSSEYATPFVRWFLELFRLPPI